MNKQAEKVVSVSIDRIAVDETMQIRNELRSWKIQEYANCYQNDADMPPLIVGERGEGFVLIAGFHRLAALTRLGRTNADVIIVQENDVPEEMWPWLAVKTNLSHGLPLTAAEMRRAFRIYVETDQHTFVAVEERHGGRLRRKRCFKSYREIAKELGGSRTAMTIYNWMKEDFPEIAKRISKKDLGRDFRKGGPCKDDESRDNAIVKQIGTLIRKAVALAKVMKIDDPEGVIKGKLAEALSDVTDDRNVDVDNANDDF